MHRPHQPSFKKLLNNKNIMEKEIIKIELNKNIREWKFIVDMLEELLKQQSQPRLFRKLDLVGINGTIQNLANAKSKMYEEIAKICPQIRDCESYTISDWHIIIND